MGDKSYETKDHEQKQRNSNPFTSVSHAHILQDHSNHQAIRCQGLDEVCP